MAFEIGRHLRGALVRTGRAAERAGGHRDDKGAAIGHGFQLLLQHQGLWAGLVGVGHVAIGERFAVAFHTRVVEIDAGGQHHRVVSKCRAAFQGNRFLDRIDRGHLVEHDIDAALLEAVIANFQVLQVAVAGNDFVGQRAGNVDLVLFDQGDVEGRRHHLQVLGGSRAAKSATDDNDLGLAGCAGVGNVQYRGRGGDGERLEKITTIELAHGRLLIISGWRKTRRRL